MTYCRDGFGIDGADTLAAAHIIAPWLAAGIEIAPIYMSFIGLDASHSISSSKSNYWSYALHIFIF
jgi:hypothetical protein